MPPVRYPKPLHPLLLALIGYALYSCKDVLTRLALHDVSIWVTPAIQYGVPLLLVPLYAGLTGHWELLRPRRWWVAIVMGLLVATSELAFIAALPRIPLATLFVLMTVTPLLVAVLGWFFLHEKLRRRQMLAVFVAFAGALSMVLARHGAGIVDAVPPIAYAMTVAAILIGAARTLFVRAIGGGEQPAVLLFWSAVVTVLVTLPLAIPELAARPLTVANVQLYGRIAAGGLCNMTAILCVWTALKRMRAAYVQSMQYSQMIWATTAGFLIWGEAPTQMTMLGGAVVIGAGLYLIGTAQLRRPGNNSGDTTPVSVSGERVVS